MSRSYPPPLSMHDTEMVRRKRMSMHVTKRVLAPYVKARYRPKPKVEENKYFSLYVQKKPSILMSDMTRLLSDAVDLVSVLHETAEVLKHATSSAVVTVYMVDEALDEIYQVGHNFKEENHRVSYKIGLNTTVAAYVAYRKEFVKVDDLIEDTRFPSGLGNQELTVKAVLCVPVVTPEEDCLAVIELHRELDAPVYDENELRLVIVMCGWIGSAVYQNQMRLTLQKQQELNDYLLDLTKCYFADTMLLDKLITEVVNFAKVALNAEHGLFFVMKPKEDELFADFYEEGIGPDRDTLFKKNVKIKLGNDSDLVSMVAQKGIIINVRNAYNDTRITQDKKKGYVTRSVLCMPIIGVDEILGVIQMINKKKGACFTKADEALFQTFSVYCAFVLSYSRLHEKMTKTSNLNSIYLEMLAQQIVPCVHDYNFVLSHPEMVTLPQRFNQFDFYITDTYEHYMPQLLMYMFNEISKDMFDDSSTMINFVLIIQKNYHNHPYHNFHHAFNVCHSMYNMVRRNTEHFTQLEMKALLLAAYCHDVDHYGVTNNFLDISSHHLAQLYDESVLENHHFHVTMFVFKQLNLFSNMNREDYKNLISEIRFLILATDLATYFKRRGKLYQICADNTFDWQDESHRSLLKSVMMTTADLSGMCKPFSIAKHIIDNVYKEFYNEGDKEKEMGLCPLSIMDREKINMIPSDQVQFMTVVVIPCALILTKLLPNCAALYKEAMKLRETWQEIFESQGQTLWSLENSVGEKKQ